MAGLTRAFALLRRFIGGSAPPLTPTASGVFSVCPLCGVCVDGTTHCPEDGSVLPPPTRIPLTLHNRYRFDRLLAQGGMGTVYRGSDLLLNRPVAIKVIHCATPDCAADRRVLGEAGTLSRVQHPSIVAIYDYGSLPDGSPYLVMEFVAGRDLRHELATEGRIEPARACRILAAVCAAMGAAHEQGILHCDLKPENVLLPDEGVEAKVLDFGVAQAIDPANTAVPAGRGPGGTTAAATLVGTPAYMAPELLRGEPPDERSDVFSIGVIACEMLLGEVPFGAGSSAEVQLAQGRGVPPAVARLPPALARAVRAALELDADRRPPTPQALAYLIGAATGTL